MRIAHLTSAHPRDDIRIFHKECRSLVGGGHEVTLVVADGLGDGTDSGVRILDVGREAGRLRRIFRSSMRVFERAAELDADLYHLHDPELIPAGLRLKRMGKRVLFDSHEDAPKQLLGKPYLHPFALRLLSIGLSKFERYACAGFDGIIGATPVIRDKFKTINARVVDINNYPMVGELNAALPWADRADEVCYVGGMAGIRGIREIVAAMALLTHAARLNLVGEFAEPRLEAEIRRSDGWNSVNVCGVQGRRGVRTIMGRCVAGLVTFHPLPNHIDAQPNKMFEYMSAGIPVIASNFPLWKEVIEGNACGICVDPMNPSEIALAMDRLLSDRALAESMGANGVRAIEHRYNWGAEAAKLLAYYETLFSGEKQ